MPQTAASNTTPSDRIATIYITSKRKPLLLASFHPGNAEVVLAKAQKAMQGQEDVIIEFHIASMPGFEVPEDVHNMLKSVKARADESIRFLVDACLSSMEDLRFVCEHYPEIYAALPQWASDLQRLVECAIARSQQAVGLRH